jgi:hypothetical protein
LQVGLHVGRRRKSGSEESSVDDDDASNEEGGGRKGADEANNDDEVCKQRDPCAEIVSFFWKPNLRCMCAAS